MHQITCACAACTTILDKPWSPGVSHTKQPHYQPVVGCIYLPVLGTFKKWKTTNFTNKTTSKEDFDDINKVVPDVISENMASLAHTGK